MGVEKVLTIPEEAQKDKASFEVLRVWIANQAQHVSIRSGAWEDPFAWGIVLADLARHVALPTSSRTKAPTPKPSSTASSKASKPK